MNRKIHLSLHNSVWIQYIGGELGRSKCWCCGLQDIDRGNYDCGHVVSRHDGGSTTLDNLRPICAACNRSMGVKDMIEFMKDCGYKLPTDLIQRPKLEECDRYEELHNLLRIERLKYNTLLNDISMQSDNKTIYITDGAYESLNTAQTYILRDLCCKKDIDSPISCDLICALAKKIDVAKKYILALYCSCPSKEDQISKRHFFVNIEKIEDFQKIFSKCSTCKTEYEIFKLHNPFYEFEFCERKGQIHKSIL